MSGEPSIRLVKKPAARATATGAGGGDTGAATTGAEKAEIAQL